MRLKKLCCVVLVVAVLMSVSVSTVAAEEISIMRADLCPQCETGTLRYVELRYGEWVKYDYELCTHGGATDYNDRLYRREVVKYFECDNSNCGYGETLGNDYDYRVYCPYLDMYFY